MRGVLLVSSIGSSGTRTTLHVSGSGSQWQRCSVASWGYVVIIARVVDTRLPRRDVIRRIVTFCAAIVAAFAVSGPRAVADEASIRAAADLWVQHYRAGDLDALMTLYDDAVIVALHGQPALYGKQAVHDYFASRIGTANVTFELDYERIEVHAKVAYLISKYWLRAVDSSGAEYKDAGRSMLIYKQAGNGDWRIAADLDQATPDVGWPSPSGLE